MCCTINHTNSPVHFLQFNDFLKMGGLLRHSVKNFDFFMLCRFLSHGQFDETAYLGQVARPKSSMGYEWGKLCSEDLLNYGPMYNNRAIFVTSEGFTLLNILIFVDSPSSPPAGMSQKLSELTAQLWSWISRWTPEEIISTVILTWP